MAGQRMMVVYAWIGGSCASIILYSVFEMLTIRLWMVTAYLWLLSLIGYFAYPANARWKRTLWKITGATLPIVGLVLLILGLPVMEYF